MIEQSHRSLVSSAPGDLEALQRRVNRQCYRHKQSPRSLETRWQLIRTNLASSVHSIVALVLPLAVALSQVQSGMLLPTNQAVASQESGDFSVPMAPLALDMHGHEGDAPLDDSEDMPVPLSLISRSEALAPVMVPATITSDRVYLRNGPGTDYDAVGRISSDTAVQVIGRYGDWFQVRERAGQPIYWISGELLNISEAAIYTLFEIQEK